MKLDYTRILRMTNAELFMISENNHSYDKLAYLLIVDTRRKSKLQDFPILIGVETEGEFEKSENFIKLLLISKNKLDMNLLEDISYFSECMLDIKPGCSYYMTEVVENYNLEFSLNDPTPILDFIKPYVEECNSNIDLSKVKNEDFKYLTQG